MDAIQYNLSVDSAGLQLIWNMLGEAPAKNSRVLMNGLEGQVRDQEAAYLAAQQAEQAAIDAGLPAPGSAPTPSPAPQVPSTP